MHIGFLPTWKDQLAISEISKNSRKTYIINSASFIKNNGGKIVQLTETKECVVYQNLKSKM